MNDSSKAHRRLFFRIVALAVIATGACYFQKSYGENADRWLLDAEIPIYFVLGFMWLMTQTGRLKSGPDTGKISSQVLFERDPSVRGYIAIYMVLLMILAVTYAMLGNEIRTGPMILFASLAPIYLIVILRQHRLERQDELVS